MLMARFELKSGYTHRESSQILQVENPNQLKELVGKHVVKTRGGRFGFLFALFSPPRVTSELDSCSYVFALEESVDLLLRDTLYTCGRFLDVTFRGQHLEYIVYRLP